MAPGVSETSERARKLKDYLGEESERHLTPGHRHGDGEEDQACDTEAALNAVYGREGKRC